MQQREILAIVRYDNTLLVRRNEKMLGIIAAFPTDLACAYHSMTATMQKCRKVTADIVIEVEIRH